MDSGVFGWSRLVARWRDSKLIHALFSLHGIIKDRHNRARHKVGHGSAGKRRVGHSGSAAVQGSDMRGVLLVPSSSPTLSPTSMMALT